MSDVVEKDGCESIIFIDRDVLDEEFTNNDIIKKVTFSKNVSIIGKRAFFGCPNLENIIFLSDDLKICEEAFCGCSSLKDLAIGSGILDSKSFADCNNLDNVFLGNNVEFEKEANGIFDSCISLKSILIHFNNKIGGVVNEMFANCISLKEIHLPDLFCFIGSSAFLNCRSLEKIVIPNMVSYVGFEAFKNCVNLKSIVFDERYDENKILEIIEGLNEDEFFQKLYDPLEIDYYAFKNCENLESINLGNGISYIDSSIFSGCKNLSIIDLNGSMLKSLKREVFNETKINNSEDFFVINGTLYDCNCLDLEVLYVPFGVEILSNNLFDYRKKTFNFDRIVLPSSLKIIGDECFYNNYNLMSIIVNSDLFVGNDVFEGCINLVDEIDCKVLKK